MENSRKEQSDEGLLAWLPDLIYTGGHFRRGLALVSDEAGRIQSLTPTGELKCRVAHLKNRAILPGLVNAHSHAFQRVLRGRTERRSPSATDTFWTWREMMYAATERLSPADIYDASRMAFLEMALAGITAVGEFHYLHNAPDGKPYEDANLLAKEVVRAAQSVGLRICLLRVAYTRSGFQTAPNVRQARFIETAPEIYLRNVEQLRKDLSGERETVWAGVAPHSVRAVPLDYLKEIIAHARVEHLPTHMHVAEQPAEIAVCQAEYGRLPVMLLESEGLLSSDFTGVHAIHVTTEEARRLANARTTVCACPTTERNLGDGIVPADLFFKEGVRLAVGTDSQAEINLLEDARELEYHLRLKRLERAVLAPDESMNSLAARLFDAATIGGAESIHARGGILEPERAADFFTVDLNDPSIAGAAEDDLLSCLFFSLSPRAVREVFVGGRQIVADGQHQEQEKIIERFNALQKRLWS